MGEGIDGYSCTPPFQVADLLKEGVAGLLVGVIWVLCSVK